MTYSEEDAVRFRIVNALRDAYPDRAEPMRGKLCVACLKTRVEDLGNYDLR